MTMSVEERRAMLEAEVAALTAAIDERGYWVEGSQGQDILNPALAARRACLEALRKLDAQASPEPDTTPLDEFLANAGA